MIFPRISGKVRPALFDNGLRVYVIPKNEAPTVTVQAWVATGSIHEDEFLGCGLSHFLEHMLFQGTEKFPGSAISDTVTHLGGYLNAYTSKTHTVYYINLPAAYADFSARVFDQQPFVQSRPHGRGKQPVNASHGALCQAFSTQFL